MKADGAGWDSQPRLEWAARHATGRFVDLDGHPAHYVEKGMGAPVILLHGFFLDSMSWQRNFDALASQHHVYALDLWGHGYSSRDSFEYSYPLFADQVRLFMDAMDIERASLVGHSMGGGTAIQFAALHPARAHKLLLVDPNGVPHGQPFAARLFNLPGVGEFLLGLNTDMVRRKLVEGFFVYDRKLLTSGCFESLVRHHKITGTSKGLLAINRRNFQDKLENELMQLSSQDIPILMVWGDMDKAVPLRLGREMHRILHGSRLEIIEDAGHLPNLERPEVFNGIALEFLGDDVLES